MDNDAADYHDWPLTYISFATSASDGSSHSVQVYVDVTAEWVVSDDRHEVAWNRSDESTLSADMFIGTTTQDFASTTSDRVDWGYGHLAVPSGYVVESAMVSAAIARDTFSSGVSLAGVDDDASGPRPANDNCPVLAVEVDISGGSGLAMLAYDAPFSINYFGTNMRPIWKGSDGQVSIDTLLASAAAAANDVLMAAATFDRELASKHESVGGKNYATLTSLVYRQTTGGIEKVWDPVSNSPWVFMKEISSDGDVSTIDVIYPASPFFFATSSPVTMRRMLLPLLVYANNSVDEYGAPKPYNLAWAPHHLGKRPLGTFPPDHLFENHEPLLS